MVNAPLTDRLHLAAKYLRVKRDSGQTKTEIDCEAWEKLITAACIRIEHLQREQKSETAA